MVQNSDHSSSATKMMMS